MGWADDQYLLFGEEAEALAEDAGKRSWKAYCGRYEQNIEDFPLEEIFMKDGKLYATVSDKEEGEKTYQLYPIGKKTFGRKGGFVKILFGEGCLTIDGITCKKL